jgi:hypothetical protein
VDRFRIWRSNSGISDSNTGNWSPSSAGPNTGFAISIPGQRHYRAATDVKRKCDIYGIWRCRVIRGHISEYLRMRHPLFPGEQVGIPGQRTIAVVPNQAIPEAQTEWSHGKGPTTGKKAERISKRRCRPCCGDGRNESHVDGHELRQRRVPTSACHAFVHGSCHTHFGRTGWLSEVVSPPGICISCTIKSPVQ